MRPASQPGLVRPPWRGTHLSRHAGRRLSGLADSRERTCRSDGKPALSHHRPDDWTGLRWTRSAGNARCTWEEALHAAVGLSQERFGGITHWRLPNIRELESLIDLKRHSPALPVGHPFQDVGEGYWSSTTSVGFKKQPTFGTLAVSGD